MKHSPILHSRVGKNNPASSAPLGAFMVYTDDEYTELEHLLEFLRTRFSITRRSRKSKAHPYVQVGDTEASLPSIILNIAQLQSLSVMVAIGFFYPKKTSRPGEGDIETFRAYMAHLQADKDPGLESTKTHYKEAEVLYFPTGKKLH